MKKQTLYHIAVSVLFLIFGSQLASAQSSESLLTVQVPFDFQVGEKLMPAGKYLIKRDSQTPRILQIQFPEQKTAVFALVTSFIQSKERSGASLTFKGYDEKHFLSEVKFSGDSLGYSFSGTKAERKLAQAAKARTIPQISSTDN
jgi:hypothetical protein